MPLNRISLRLADLIEDAKARGITKTEIARAIGISPQHLSGLINGHVEWKGKQIDRLLQKLQIYELDITVDSLSAKKQSEKVLQQFLETASTRHLKLFVSMIECLVENTITQQQSARSSPHRATGS